MNIYIKSVHFKTDKGLEDYISKKLQKIGKLHEGIIRSDVTLKLENVDTPENKIAEIRLKIKGNDIMASKQCKTFEEATSLAVEAIQKQLDKTKDKTINYKAKLKAKDKIDDIPDEI
ncbi:MAG: ribosome-associated translation inhibitor RaiA [Bacteroidales bacterium]|jgi:putative sigma-54 modulation protein|nr:ribosome-associated translation inhibitor RaiA [Bacteroidales bacterium]